GMIVVCARGASHACDKTAFEVIDVNQRKSLSLVLPKSVTSRDQRTVSRPQATRDLLSSPRGSCRVSPVPLGLHTKFQLCHRMAPANFGMRAFYSTMRLARNGIAHSGRFAAPADAFGQAAHEFRTNTAKTLHG